MPPKDAIGSSSNTTTTKTTGSTASKTGSTSMGSNRQNSSSMGGGNQKGSGSTSSTKSSQTGSKSPTGGSMGGIGNKGSTAKAPSKTGSGQIGSKGGGASTQKPGAMKREGPVSGATLAMAQGQNAANRQQSLKSIGSNKSSPTKDTGFGGGFKGPGVTALNQSALSTGRAPPNTNGPRADNPRVTAAPTAGLGAYLGKDQERLRTEVSPGQWTKLEADKQNRLARTIRDDWENDTIVSYDPLGSIKAPVRPQGGVAGISGTGYAGYGSFDSEMGRYAVDKGILGSQIALKQQSDALVSGANSPMADPQRMVAPAKQSYDRVPTAPAALAAYNPLSSFVTPNDMRDRIAQGSVYSVPLPTGALNVSGIPTPQGGIAGIQKIQDRILMTPEQRAAEIAAQPGAYASDGANNERMLYNTSPETLARMNAVFSPEGTYSGYGDFAAPVAETTAINPAAVGQLPAGFQYGNPIVSSRPTAMAGAWPGQSAVPPNPAVFTPGPRPQMTVSDINDPFTSEIGAPPYNGNPGVWANQMVGFDPLSGPVARPSTVVAAAPVRQAAGTYTTPYDVAAAPALRQAAGTYTTPYDVAENPQRPVSVPPGGIQRVSNIFATNPRYLATDLLGQINEGYDKFRPRTMVENVPTEQPRPAPPITTDEFVLPDPEAPTDRYIGPVYPGEENDPRTPVFTGPNNFAWWMGQGAQSPQGQTIVPTAGPAPSTPATPPSGGADSPSPPQNNGLDWFKYYGLNPPYQTIVPTPPLQTAPVSQGMGSLLPNIVVVDPFAPI